MGGREVQIADGCPGLPLTWCGPDPPPDCRACEKPHGLREDLPFGDTSVDTVEYVAMAGTDQEHRLSVKRPPDTSIGHAPGSDPSSSSGLLVYRSYMPQ